MLAKGDTRTTCFSHITFTGVPGLNNFCQELARNANEATARQLIILILIFCKSCIAHLQGLSDVTHADRETAEQKWRSTMMSDDDASISDFCSTAEDSDSAAGDSDSSQSDTRWGPNSRRLRSTTRAQGPPTKSTSPEITGIAHQLAKVLTI